MILRYRPRRSGANIGQMSNIEFSDEEHAAVTATLRRAVYGRSFPRWPRLEPLRAALAKLDPTSAPESPYPCAHRYQKRLCDTVAAGERDGSRHCRSTY
jgi:hypothetical protein